MSKIWGMIPGVKRLFCTNAVSAVRKFMKVAPEKFEEKILQMVNNPDNNGKEADFIRTILEKSGIMTKIGKIEVTNTDKDGESGFCGKDAGEKSIVYSQDEGAEPVPDEHDGSRYRMFYLSGETGEMLIDSLADYLKSSVRQPDSTQSYSE